jgi:uncharacterized repeat protein (TIGR03847 family)
VIDVELTEPHHLTAGYTGVPGQRTFYLQAEDTSTRATFLVEKLQVEALGQLLGQLLTQLGDEPAGDWDRAAMELRTPVEPRWRVGGIEVGVVEDTDHIVLELEEAVAEDDEEPREARLWADRDQTRRLAAHAQEVVGEGRPRCELCGRPTEPDGTHVCPATNGHGRLSR